MIFSSKRGMSPLIATVLLIAFAVAMGAMIMNWSAGIEAEDDPQVVFCEGISLTTETGACYADGKLSFKIGNNGKERIDGILLSSIADGTSIDIRVPDTSMIVGETIERDTPFLSTSGAVELEFVPLVAGEEIIYECRSGGFSQSELPPC